MSVIMSDMKPMPKAEATARKPLPDTFTVRDLHRQAATVLLACIVHGSVRICARAGESYCLTREETKKAPPARVRQAVENLRRHHEQMRAMGYRAPSKKEQLRIDRWTAGEE